MGVSLRAYGQLLARYLKHQWSRFALLVMLVCSSIGLVESLQNIGATVERLQELFDQKSTIVDGPSAAIPAGRPLALEFDSVSFSYTEGKPVLKNVSFQLPAGRVLGLLGCTGGGKTTIARLLFRLYDPTDGCIMLDGIDIKQATLAELRQRVAYVTQDVQLFQASVRDNITFFDRSIPDARILEVIEALGLAEWYRILGPVSTSCDRQDWRSCSRE
ncbi:MAG: ABC transporter ATP-binding protein [Bacillota bacterium]